MSAVAALRRPTIDATELVILVATVALASWILALDLWQVVAHGRSRTRTGPRRSDAVPAVQDASRHLLVSNLFMLGPSSADFVQPLIIVSGGLTALGVAPHMAVLLWQPVAIIGLFLAARAYVHRALDPATSAGVPSCSRLPGSSWNFGGDPLGLMFRR